jgi:uncharacterized membrane protein YeaQ/YmgE (transglycosylase-associated protein family)
MSIIWMLVVGLVVGAIAKLMMPGKDPGGIFVTMLLGVAGALVAGFLGRGLGWYREGEPVGLFASIIGAIVLLALYRMVAPPAPVCSDRRSGLPRPHPDEEWRLRRSWFF